MRTEKYQIARRSRSENDILYTIVLTQRALCYRNHTRQERASRVSTTETVISELNKYYKHARRTSGKRGIKVFHNNAPAHKSKLLQEYLSKDLEPCTLFCFHVEIKASREANSTSVQLSDPPFSSVWTTSQKRTTNMHLNNGYKD